MNDPTSDFEALQKLMNERSSSESAAAVRTLFLGFHWCIRKGMNDDLLLDVLRFERDRRRAEERGL